MEPRVARDRVRLGELRMRSGKKCNTCDGDPYDAESKTFCPTCEGTGFEMYSQANRSSERG
jgi:DnaJ-class molecular chaperone